MNKLQSIRNLCVFHLALLVGCGETPVRDVDGETENSGGGGETGEGGSAGEAVPEQPMGGTNGSIVDASPSNIVAPDAGASSDSANVTPEAAAVSCGAYRFPAEKLSALPKFAAIQLAADDAGSLYALGRLELADKTTNLVLATFRSSTPTPGIVTISKTDGAIRGLAVAADGSEAFVLFAPSGKERSLYRVDLAKGVAATLGDEIKFADASLTFGTDSRLYFTRGTANANGGYEFNIMSMRTDRADLRTVTKTALAVSNPDAPVVWGAKLTAWGNKGIIAAIEDDAALGGEILAIELENGVEANRKKVATYVNAQKTVGGVLQQGSYGSGVAMDSHGHIVFGDGDLLRVIDDAGVRITAEEAQIKSRWPQAIAFGRGTLDCRSAYLMSGGAIVRVQTGN